MVDVDTNNLENTLIKKINEELLLNLKSYRKTLSYMYADAPIEALCLPKTLENLLINNGLLRIYDLFDRDFTEIKGMGDIRIRQLTASLNQFIAMC